jgi:hypothetical protein
MPSMPVISSVRRAAAAACERECGTVPPHRRGLCSGMVLAGECRRGVYNAHRWIVATVIVEPTSHGASRDARQWILVWIAATETGQEAQDPLLIQQTWSRVAP